MTDLFEGSTVIPVPLTGPVVVTGTDTGVGKTIVTAAIAATATAAGLSVAVVKPAQTGTADGDEPDARTVARLAEPASVRTLAEYPDPLAPLAAARVAGEDALTAVMAQLAIRGAAENHDLTLIEGAGGLLVPMGEGGWTVLDLAAALDATAVVVARAGLGTLNHTALTLEALARRGVPALVVLGAWPADPELVHRTNLFDLPGELAGAVPDGAGALAPELFRREAPHWLADRLHGRFDPVAFRSHSK
ncbi:dethiobiotin synthase [Dactylosporangium sucinum]|uniref:ATP-dependent dethiobiotin synthetase BioD n=1 Tax=Dactylosporangium sucinum TaxID=1424081 RepID=A0A917TYB2_9ACTN|nr:dethiobiotin synthase [Dactylosporangium sucinum]GGM43626.1 ATP-dependent dethiobiotin synthetase BioD [Dactylosporangium sucinum]